jgi:hypothetical protein
MVALAPTAIPAKQAQMEIPAVLAMRAAQQWDSIPALAVEAAMARVFPAVAVAGTAVLPPGADSLHLETMVPAATAAQEATALTAKAVMPVRQAPTAQTD